jgi:hypothetical protein
MAQMTLVEGQAYLITNRDQDDNLVYDDLTKVAIFLRKMSNGRYEFECYDTPPGSTIDEKTWYRVVIRPCDVQERA